MTSSRLSWPTRRQPHVGNSALVSRETKSGRTLNLAPITSAADFRSLERADGPMNYAVTRVPGFPAWYRHDQTPRREHTERGPGKIEEKARPPTAGLDGIQCRKHGTRTNFIVGRNPSRNLAGRIRYSIHGKHRIQRKEHQTCNVFIFAKFDAEIRAVLGFLSACTGLTLLPGDANLPVTGQIHRLFGE